MRGTFLSIVRIFEYLIRIILNFRVFTIKEEVTAIFQWRTFYLYVY